VCDNSLIWFDVKNRLLLFLALMLIQGIEIDFIQFLGFMMMLGIAWLQRLVLVERWRWNYCFDVGINAENQALMIALYIAMDSFGTAEM
jgi:hypothetical protein